MKLCAQNCNIFKSVIICYSFRYSFYGFEQIHDKLNSISCFSKLNVSENKYTLILKKYEYYSNLEQYRL